MGNGWMYRLIDKKEKGSLRKGNRQIHGGKMGLGGRIRQADR